jgi:uncharacterized protein YrzB (UPF0473 family)
MTFRNEKNNKDYVIYTDNGIDSYNKLKIYAAVYDPFTNEFLEVPESKEEWHEIYKVLDNVMLDK